MQDVLQEFWYWSILFRVPFVLLVMISLGINFEGSNILGLIFKKLKKIGFLWMSVFFFFFFLIYIWRLSRVDVFKELYTIKVEPLFLLFFFCFIDYHFPIVNFSAQCFICEQCSLPFLCLDILFICEWFSFLVCMINMYVSQLLRVCSAFMRKFGLFFFLVSTFLFSASIVS